MGISLNPINFPSATAIGAIAKATTQLSRIAAVASTAPVSEVNAKRDFVSVSSTGTERFGLSQIGAALETTAKISNSLATADQALSTLGNLLGTVHSTLTVTQPQTAANDQRSIDTTLASIDRLAGTTTFGGKKLLDGTFSTSLNGSTLAIPSFATSKLGNSTVTSAENSLASLSTNSGHGLTGSAGNSTAIVTTAINQVTSARQKITDFQTQSIQPFTDAGQSALEHLIASPSIESPGSAASNAILARAQGLLQPAATLAAFAPNTNHVLELLR